MFDRILNTLPIWYLQMTSVNMRLPGKDYEVRDKLWKIVSKRNCIEKGLAAVPIRGCNDEKVNSIIPFVIKWTFGFNYRKNFENIKLDIVSLLFRGFRSSRSQMFFKTGFLKYFAIFIGKHLCWSLMNKVAGLMPCSFINERLQHRCFSVNTAKFLRAGFFIGHLRWLLLWFTQLG